MWQSMNPSLLLFVGCLICLSTVAAENGCDAMATCNDCRKASGCFWCPKLESGSCMSFYSRSITSLLCSNPAWETYRCQEGTQESKTINRILDIMARIEKLKGLENNVVSSTTVSSPTTRSTLTTSSSEEGLSSEQLMNKLASLKAFLHLKEIQEKSKTSNGVERASPNVHKVGTASSSKGSGLSLEEELNKDLEKISYKAVTEIPASASTTTVEQATSKPTIIITQPPITTTKQQTTLSSRRTSSPTTTTMKTTSWEQELHEENNHVNGDTVKLKSPHGCASIAKELACNVELNCSWCHISDECVGRNDVELRKCFHNDKRIVEKDFGVDPCMHHVTCGACTDTKGKCYWCEHTKSCHLYPFFGFVPHTCPTNHWYYKQCNVQFALLLFMFPLLLVLVSMLIFYFCLRYCFYRKRLVKVPLFEKVPGSIYEKKKGKKIYFMSGEEDEDSRAEKIRKKYQLPAEKEPLIAP